LVLGLRGEEFRKKGVYYLPLRIEEVLKGMSRGWKDASSKNLHFMGSGRLDSILGSYLIPGIASFPYNLS
jgi:hypothetical protein